MVQSAIVELDEEVHRLIHLYQNPPNKPSDAVMEAFLTEHPRGAGT
jgi:hypothetical protein